MIIYNMALLLFTQIKIKSANRNENSQFVV